MPDKLELEKVAAPPQLERGASNAVSSCLGLTDADKVTLICDERSLPIAAALHKEILAVGAKDSVFILERRAPRPITELPPEVERSLKDSTASIYTAHPKETEHTHRLELIGLVGPYKLKHAHMISISEDAMLQGMLSDYRRVARLNRLMTDKLKSADQVRVTCPKGTDVMVDLSHLEPIESAAGVIEPGHWENLPSGEIFTCPKSAEGMFVCDGIPPTEDPVDRFEMGRRPLRIEIADGRLVTMTQGPTGLVNKVLAAIRSGKNVDRIGMIGIGTNYELLMPIGDRIQDQFVPGAYFSFGRPATVGTASWTSSQQFVFSARKTTVEIDGEMVIDGGRYVKSLLDATRGD